MTGTSEAIVESLFPGITHLDNNHRDPGGLGIIILVKAPPPGWKGFANTLFTLDRLNVWFKGKCQIKEHRSWNDIEEAWQWIQLERKRWTSYLWTSSNAYDLLDNFEDFLLSELELQFGYVLDLNSRTHLMAEFYYGSREGVERLAIAIFQSGPTPSIPILHRLLEHLHDFQKSPTTDYIEYRANYVADRATFLTDNEPTVRSPA